MDFSAWFEVWLGGAWRTVDARHNRPAHRPHPDGAWAATPTDVAITTSFGPITLAGFEVMTEELA